jgi:TetR/AcrR family transcriptional regulator
VSPGRRERNKAEKLERIMTAASALFAEHGIEDVTTQQVADAADIGTGTLFLYARTKGDLLLMVQNAHYAEALAAGRKAAAEVDDPVEAILALITPVIACNRVHIGNGRVYLREMVFGASDDVHRAEALRISGETEDTVDDIVRRAGASPAIARTAARLVMAATLVAMAASPDAASVEEIVADLRSSISLVLP